MSLPLPDWAQIDGLDDVAMDAADGGHPALLRLAEALEAHLLHPPPLWPAALHEFWRTAAELVLDGLDRTAIGPVATRLALALAAADIESVPLRDTLVAAARAHFADYPDPAGLLDAFGLRTSDTPVSQIRKRWDTFAECQPGTACWHAAHGVGEIAEIDGLANDVHVRFERPNVFGLKLALTSLLLVRRKSFLADLCTGRLAWPAAVQRPNLGEVLAHSLVAVTRTSALDAAPFLVPRFVGEAAFAAALGRGASSAPDTPTPGNAPGVAAQRDWSEARGIDELVDLLARVETVDAPPVAYQNLADVLRHAAPKANLASAMVESIARLWSLAGGQPWLTELLHEIAPDAACWQDRALFVGLTDRLAGKLMPAWARATAVARGPEYLASATLDLPLRLWSTVERTLAGIDGAGNLLEDRVAAALRAVDASADALVWLWKSTLDLRRELANPTLLFRTLAKPVRGSYLKAQKELRKLLLENDSFQRLVLRDGDTEATISLVRCARHLPLLDNGEQQSLLVRIVRLYPEARSLVEDRRRHVPRKPIGRLTSARSFELRRRELTEIVNSKIPANSRAIAQAREHGDLRENAEYKAAKDEQRYLTARRDELENELHDIRATDFHDVVVRDQVVPGCTVALRDANGNEHRFHLLGLWDSDPGRHMLSYETPVGQMLLGAHCGDELAMPNGETMTLTAIVELTPEIKDWVLGSDL